MTKPSGLGALAFLQGGQSKSQLDQITNQGQIKGFIAFNEDGSPLTQTDYDALPPSKDTDNFIYVIRG